MLDGPREVMHKADGTGAREVVTIPRCGADQQTMKQSIVERHHEIAAQRIDGSLHAIGGIGERKTRAENGIDQIVLQERGMSLRERLVTTRVSLVIMDYGPLKWGVGRVLYSRQKVGYGGGKAIL